MTIATLTLPRRDAWNAFQAYRAAVRQRHTVEDDTLMRAYRAVAADRKVLDLIAVMRDAGVDAQGRPRLAIQRADCGRVFCRVDWNGSAHFRVESSPRSNASRRSIVRLPELTFPRPPGGSLECRAVVPIIPPLYRPADSLERYHLLWEAQWTDVPKDPLLLRHLGLHLYAVMAQWDLTPLEQAVLRSRT